MLSKVFRIGFAAILLLFLSIGLYGQFQSRCEQNNLRNSVVQSEAEKQYIHDNTLSLDEADDIADIDDNFDSFVKVFSFASAAVFLLFFLLPAAVASLNFRKNPPVYLQLLASHSFLQTYRV